VETITGELIAHRVVGKDFWSIASIKTRHDGTVPAVGKLLGAQLGDTVELDGDWSEHKTFGRQFKVRECNVTIPQTENGAIAWIASRLPNIGTGRATEMIRHFGGADGLWSVIERTPARLVEIKGVTAERVDEIVSAYARFRSERDRMIRFRRWGLTEFQIARVLARWGNDAEDKMRANPYELAEFVDGFGFIRADAIAQRMGVPADAVPRIECGLRHTIEQAAGHGHCYVATGKLIAIAAERVLRIEEKKVAAELAKMRTRGEFVQHGKRTFARRLNEFEQRCADAIRALLAQKGKA
jgi:exodeoxyribonuclease V alpha subunit